MGTEEIVIDYITLFRCYTCGYLITVNEVESGEGCKLCRTGKMVAAKSVTPEENKRLEDLYRRGELKLFLGNRPA